MRSRARVVAIAVLSVSLAPPSMSTSAQPDTTARVVASAQAVLKTLDEAQRARVQFPFESPQKTNWSNLPSGIYKRNSLRIGDLTPAARDAVMNLLSVALSPEGYRKVNDIMLGDDVLRMDAAGRG